MKRFLILPLITVCLIAVIKIGEMATPVAASPEAAAEISTEVSTEPMQVIEIHTETTEPSEPYTEETIEEVQEATYSNADYQILLQVLTGECQNCSYEHQTAVGSVFLNRVKSPYYPDTFYDVAHQKGQYACFKDGNAYREPTELSKEVAKYLMLNGSQLPASCVYQAQFKQGSGVYAKYGNEYICYR